MRFPAHPELLEDTGRAGVPRLEPPDDPVEAELLEGEGEHRPRGLGRVALDVMCGMEDEAELALAVCLARPEQGDVTYELAVLPECDRGAEPLAFAPDRRAGDLVREKLARLLRRADVVVEPTDDRLVRVDRMESVQIALLERAEE